MRAKRFLKYFIMPAVLVGVWFALFLLSSEMQNEDVAGALGAICIFVVTPAIIYTLFKAIVSIITDMQYFKKNGYFEPITPYWERDNMFSGIIKSFKKFSELSDDEKPKYVAIKAGGLIIAAMGLYIIIKGMDSSAYVVVGTLVLIGGTTLCLIAG